MQTAGSGWQICAQMHDRLGESVLWHPQEEALYWIDFYGPSVHRKQWNGGPVETWQIDRSGTIGSFVFADEGRLILAVDHGLHLFDTKSPLPQNPIELGEALQSEDRARQGSGGRPPGHQRHPACAEERLSDHSVGCGSDSVLPSAPGWKPDPSGSQCARCSPG